MNKFDDLRFNHFFDFAEILAANQHVDESRYNFELVLVYDI